MKNRIILKIRGGSNLYGTAIPGKSDEDFIGIYLSTPEELLGLVHSEIIDDSVISKQENGRNASDAVDCKYYELRKFCNLALNANPTILEMLFANEENTIILDEYGKELVNNKNLFLSTKIKTSFLGYAFSQMRKSEVKSKYLRELVDGRLAIIKYLKQYPTHYNKTSYEFIGANKVVAEPFNGVFKLDEFFPNYISIGDMRFNNSTLKSIIKKLNERINKATSRADGMLKNGLDFKFISHTLRLLFEGEELLRTGNITFPLKDSSLLLDVKKEKYTPLEVMDMIGDLEEKREIWSQIKTPLPIKPQFDKVNKLVYNIYKRYLENA